MCLCWKSSFSSSTLLFFRSSESFFPFFPSILCLISWLKRRTSNMNLKYEPRKFCLSSYLWISNDMKRKRKEGRKGRCCDPMILGQTWIIMSIMRFISIPAGVMQSLLLFLWLSWGWIPKTILSQNRRTHMIMPILRMRMTMLRGRIRHDLKWGGKLLA